MWYSLFARLGGFLLIAAIWYAVIMASAGCEALTQMSDDWCAAHPAASQARCWGHGAPRVPAKAPAMDVPTTQGD